jgi:(p)ppGpp synthase/HD superfamily hydrolase
MQEKLPHNHNSIFVITYTGDVLSLHAGANVLDFAYRVHSDVGNFAQNALINNQSTSLFSQISE